MPPSQAEERRKRGQALIPTPGSPAFPISPFGCFQHTRNRTRTLDLSNGKATGVTSMVLHAFLQKDSGREQLGCAGKPGSTGEWLPTQCPRWAARLLVGEEPVRLVRLSRLFLKLHGQVTGGCAHGSSGKRSRIPKRPSHRVLTLLSLWASSLDEEYGCWRTVFSFPCVILFLQSSPRPGFKGVSNCTGAGSKRGRALFCPNCHSTATCHKQLLGLITPPAPGCVCVYEAPGAGEESLQRWGRDRFWRQIALFAVKAWGKPEINREAKNI